MHTTIKQAQRQGASYALRATLVTEVIIALLFFTFLLSVTGSAQMFWDIATYLGVGNFTVFILSSLLFAILIGRRAGVKVLVKKKRHAWIGLISGLEVVLLSTVLCSLVTLLMQATAGALEKGWLLNYVMKPFAWLGLLCLVPVSIAGLWYGHKLKSKLVR
ncbi:hypothetical protein [Sabulibacter ruber]|uniref:hypothetical protein n=1 Tax=Sabulibacter ruber TaxID=2811901 RepID=UPI001A96395B|nr:hypothetical protein [Sabulibacter ruber]